MVTWQAIKLYQSGDLFPKYISFYSLWTIYISKPLANLLSSKTISTHNQRERGLSFFMKALFHRKRNVGPGVNRRYFYVSLSVLQDELSHEVKPGWPSTCRGLDENKMSSTHTGENDNWQPLNRRQLPSASFTFYSFFIAFS